MSDESTQDDWIADLTEPSDDDESPSLFEENFEKMVDEGSVEGMTIDTLDGQIELIDSVELLNEAKAVDDRKGANQLYDERIDELTDNDSETEPTADGGEQESSDDGEADDDSVLDESDETESGGGDGDETVEVESAEPEPTGADETSSDEEDADPSADDEDPSARAGQGQADPDGDESGSMPDVDVSSLAPDAVGVDEAASAETARTLMVWGPEGAGKSHVAHTAPEPICYIDTEGKADELAPKFDDKQIFYFQADDYEQAVAAMNQSLDVLSEFLEQGVRGTLVVDSMTAMWEYAKVDYAEHAFQTDNLAEVEFKSELEGEKDWTKIKARHNTEFRDRILEQPYHVVMTSGQKEDYNAVFDGGGKQMVPDGEKWNRYAVKDVVRLRRDDDGLTVGDLKKAAKTRYSFLGLEWPTWDSIYDAIDRIVDVENSPGQTDISNWEFDVVEGQPVAETPEGSGEGDGDE